MRYLKQTIILFLLLAPAYSCFAVTMNINITEHPHSTVLVIGTTLRTNFPMLKVSLSASGGPASLTSLIITNNGTVPFVTSEGQFNGVTKVSLYQDDAGGTSPTEFDTNDNLLASAVINTAQSASFSGLTLQLEDGASALLFVVYDFGNSSSILGQQALAKVSTLNTSVTSVINQNNSTTVKCSGGYISSAEDISSEYIFRSEDPVAVLKVTIDLYGEPMESLQILLENAPGNFNTNVFEKVSIYQDSTTAGTQGCFDLNSDIARDVQTSFSSAGQLAFTITSGNQLVTGNYVFFVVYDVKSSCAIGTEVQAQIASVYITGKTSGESTTILGTLPTPTTPADMTIIEDYTLAMTDVQVLADHPVYQGGSKVPVLKFSLQKLDTQLGNTITIKVRNQGSCAFSSVADGVSKVWLYKDSNVGGTRYSYDSQDLLQLTASTFTNSNKDVEIKNIAIPEALTSYFLLYDIGLAASGTFNARIQDMVTSGNLFMSNTIPHAITVSQNIVTSSITVDSVTSNIFLIGSQCTEDIYVTLNIRNNSDIPLKLTYAAPKFYQGSINGIDLSAEYLLEPLSSFPITINPGVTAIGTKILTRNITTHGTILLDSVVQVSSMNTTSVVSRYLVSAGQYSRTVSDNSIYWQVQYSRDENSWDYPAHVLTVNTLYSNTSRRLESGDPVQSLMPLQVYFNQNVINESTFQVNFNSAQCSQIGDPGSIFEYSYDTDRGLFQTKTPTSSGTLTIRLFDKAGVSLSDLSLYMTVDEELELGNFMLYPNPFLPDSVNTLILAFTLNKEAWLDFYVINAGGRVIWSSTDNHYDTNTIDYIGYNEYRLPGVLDSNNYLPSGIYSVRVIARDADDKKVYARTKLAVR
ncbi:MAG: hypothetical protein ABIH39_03495 [Candidatus Margulisiibacteriota bacterium]